MRNTLARLLVLPLVAVGVLIAGPGVAGACACGAVLADERLEPGQETALVQLTGDTEAVTLNLATRTEATKAAFLMPVPGRARFELADAEVFADLDAVSRPRIEYRDVEVDGDGSGGGAPQGAEPPVTVTDHTDVGPFEVAQLTGTDSTAVTRWLAGHDFELPADLAGALTPYLAEGWHVVAVRLDPDTAGATFADGLPSMRMTFRTDEPVYPMRLSATADHSQPLRLYVLADHRMDVTGPSPGAAEPELTYANRLSRANLAEYPALAELASGPRFLTRYDATFQPDTITDDIHLARAENDEPYRAVVVQERYVSSDTAGSVLAWIAIVAGGVVLLTVGFVLWRQGKRAATRRAVPGG
jgi:Uncharacterized protein conserved in bacteria (DUF2330)